MCAYVLLLLLFFLNATATTEIYTLSLHDAFRSPAGPATIACKRCTVSAGRHRPDFQIPQDRHNRACPCTSRPRRSEEHTSELQSLRHLVCRLLLEKKNNIHHTILHTTLDRTHQW